MRFSEIIGQNKVKQHLIASVKENRVPHAQLFLGPEGSGSLPLALAYAQYISCENKTESDSCGTCSSCSKYSKLIHPDLHFLYPQIIRKKDEDRVRVSVLSDWREALIENPYLSVNDWYSRLDIENKQGVINVEDVNELIRKLFLKSFEAEYKVAIIWLPEKMNIPASNKMLKSLEEPADKTLFILVAENGDALLPTILSRTQLIKINSIPDEDLFTFFADHEKVEYHKAKSIALLADGNMNEALKLVHGKANMHDVMKVREWFLMCHGYQKKVGELIDWVDGMQKEGRENQKNFISNSIHVVRESFLISCGRSDLVRLEGEELVFAQKFSRLIHPKNCSQFVDSLGKAHYHIERNANAKVLFLDLSLRLGRLLQVKA